MRMMRREVEHLEEGKVIILDLYTLLMLILPCNNRMVVLPKAELAQIIVNLLKAESKAKKVVHKL